ncbi:DUF1330 domain-containing protein [Methylocucumis oryzae]|uniref:DUF1330 domain-containing protein n=1 Tax=Methylocucumis oryzae TaxID=1632867 RepID=A0A0F3IHZ4_9GAMM|nr:DUF1330 domain-containing protein [Methylocucumis oryzae]KJV06287.1 hypothetical protein VZ94_12170 [Methylocucumis oryzae]
MSAYIIVSFTPTDAEQLQHYATAVPATLSPYNGELLAKGPAENLQGDSGFTLQALIAFPSKAEASAWYGSAAYQALVPLRDAAMVSQFSLLA